MFLRCEIGNFLCECEEPPNVQKNIFLSFKINLLDCCFFESVLLSNRIFSTIFLYFSDFYWLRSGGKSESAAMVDFTVELQVFIIVCPPSVLARQFFSSATTESTNHQQFFCAQKNKIRTNVNHSEQTERAKNMATNTNSNIQGNTKHQIKCSKYLLNFKNEQKIK